MRGGEGPPGAVSIWSWSPLFFGRPLNLVLYMPFRIFAYSSNIRVKYRSETYCWSQN
jgi:hypothetical protein